MKKSVGLKFNSLRNSIVRKVSRGNYSRKRSTATSGRSAVSESPIKLDFFRDKRFNLIFKVVGIAVLILLAYSLIEGIIFYSRLRFSRFPQDTHTVSEFSRNGRSNIMIVGLDEKESGHIFVDRVMILHLNQVAGKMGILSVDTRLSARVDEKNAMPLRVTFDEGKSNGKSLQNLVTATENLLAIKIDRYIITDTNKVKDFLKHVDLPFADVPKDIFDADFDKIPQGSSKLNADQAYNFLATEVLGDEERMERLSKYMKSFITNFFSPLNIVKYRSLLDIFSKSIYTDMTNSEFMNIFFFVRNLRDDQIILSNTKFDTGLPVRNDYYRLSPVIENIDRDLKPIFVNFSVITEQAKVEVLNATTTSGIATRKARLLQNTGCRIINIGNTPDEYSKNYIYVKDYEKYKETVNEILSNFDSGGVIVKSEYPGRHIGDVIVIIGEGE